MPWTSKQGGRPGYRLRFTSRLAAFLACLVWACTLQGQGTSAPPDAQDQPSTPVPAAPPQPPPISVLIDPAHGGSETGALLNPTTAEKEVNLGFARHLRQALNERGIPSQLMREGDQTLSADERAARANARRPALYLVLHSSSAGAGLAVYSAILGEAPSARGPFLDWENAQSAVLARSRSLQQKLVAAIAKSGFPVRSLGARLRPLNNLAVPALAVELAPTRGDASQLSLADYQQMVASELANALTSIAPYLRARLDSAP